MEVFFFLFVFVEYLCVIYIYFFEIKYLGIVCILRWKCDLSNIIGNYFDVNKFICVNMV